MAVTLLGWATSENDTSDTSHTVDLPGGVAADDLLIMFFGILGDAISVTWPSGWTEVHVEDNQTGSSPTLAVAYKVSAGSEPASETVTIDLSSRMAAVVYRLDGAAAAAPDAAGSQGQNTQNPDSPSLSPAGGSDDYMWISSYAASYGNDAIPTASPTNYSGSISAANPSNTSTRVATAVAYRALTAATEDPGQWTHAEPTSGSDYAAVTLAVAPEGAGPPLSTFYPASDIKATGWDSHPTASQSLFAQIDETSRSDTDFIRQEP